MRRSLRVYRDWFFLFSYLAAAFIILPASTFVGQTLVDIMPVFSLLIVVFVYGAVIGIAAFLVFYVIAAKKPRRILRFFVLILITVAGLYGLDRIALIHDRLHVVGYSLLSFFLFRVIRFYNPTTAIYVWCIIFITIAGFMDESIQFFLPGRNFSLTDIAIDLYSGILSQCAIAFVIVPRLEGWKVRMSFLKKDLLQRDKWVREYKRKRAAR